MRIYCTIKLRGRKKNFCLIPADTTTLTTCTQLHPVPELSKDQSIPCLILTLPYSINIHSRTWIPARKCTLVSLCLSSCPNLNATILSSNLPSTVVLAAARHDTISQLIYWTHISYLIWSLLIPQYAPNKFQLTRHYLALPQDKYQNKFLKNVFIICYHLKTIFQSAKVNSYIMNKFLKYCQCSFFVAFLNAILCILFLQYF